MEIEFAGGGAGLAVILTGRLDTMTSPRLQEALDARLADVSDLTFDFKALDYISSAGLRVLLSCNKKMRAKGGTMKICGANASVLEVFDITGFADIFTLA